MDRRTDLLIIGAGPFGLALAADARHRGIDHLVVGKPMEFWKRNMPDGMYLRSDCDWHLDPNGEHTIERYLATRGQTPADVEPLSLRFYLEYTAWFREREQIETLPACVERLRRRKLLGRWPRWEHAFPRRHWTTARRCRRGMSRSPLDSGTSTNQPAALTERLPAGRFSHTCDLVDFSDLRGRRCLILGGRQSARSSGPRCCVRRARQTCTSRTGTTAPRSSRPTGRGSSPWWTESSTTRAGFAGCRPRNSGNSSSASGRRDDSRWNRGSSRGSCAIR